jgi:hypothetical protein
MVQALSFLDGHVIDAGDPPFHQAIGLKFPVFIPVAAEPVSVVVAPLIGKPYGDAFPREGPKLLGRPCVPLLGVHRPSSFNVGAWQVF